MAEVAETPIHSSFVQISMGTTTSSSMPTVLNDLLAEFIDTAEFPQVHRPQDINNGLCREFAERAVRRYSGPEPTSILSHGFEGNQRIAHVWIQCGGKHYDAQRISGVASPEELPIFQQGGVHNFDPNIVESR